MLSSPTARSSDAAVRPQPGTRIVVPEVPPGEEKTNRGQVLSALATILTSALDDHSRRAAAVAPRPPVPIVGDSAMLSRVLLHVGRAFTRSSCSNVAFQPNNSVACSPF